jgi:hypothetical protein
MRSGIVNRTKKRDYVKEGKHKVRPGIRKPCAIVGSGPLPRTRPLFLPSAQVRAKKRAHNSIAKQQQATFLQKPISKKKERIDRKRLERVPLR